ncbi:MAG: DUF2202 domain-containing protein [Sulfurovum sp.]|nr:DUF2202 domain-containing protein [Sulfurovum sp.]
MKNGLLKTLIATGTVLGVIGCGGGSTSGILSDVEIAIDEPVSKLSQELIDTLAYMGNEERLAYDVYNALYTQYGTQQFTNVATNGEYQHITAVQELIQKYKLNDDVNFTNVVDPLGYLNTPIEAMDAGTYDIPAIQYLYSYLMGLAVNETEALKVGCIIEVVDVYDLDHDIALAEAEGATDIVTVFNFLRDGSYSHYWAFDKGLKNKGIMNGCCSLGVVDGVDYCHSEYPQK